MKEILTVVSVICASSLLCTLVSTFITDASTKKIINLVLGIFMICCMILPIKNACSSFDLDMSEYKSAQDITSTDDEAYSRAVINQTKANLEQALTDLLLQNNITINRCEIILSLTDNNSIIISSVSIYINNNYTDYTDLISNITYDNFSIMPNIMTE